MTMTTSSLPFPFFQLKRVDIPLDSSGDSDGANSASLSAMQQQQQRARRDRSRSPRPQTLPGLVRDGEAEDDAAVMKIPGLKQLAGTALINSPQAPQPVKAFASTLVEGLLMDTIAKQVIRYVNLAGWMAVCNWETKEPKKKQISNNYFAIVEALKFKQVI